MFPSYLFTYNFYLFTQSCFFLVIVAHSSFFLSITFLVRLTNCIVFSRNILLRRSSVFLVFVGHILHFYFLNFSYFFFFFSSFSTLYLQRSLVRVNLRFSWLFSSSCYEVFISWFIIFFHYLSFVFQICSFLLITLSVAVCSSISIHFFCFVEQLHLS